MIKTTWIASRTIADVRLVPIGRSSMQHNHIPILPFVGNWQALHDYGILSAGILVLPAATGTDL